MRVTILITLAMMAISGCTTMNESFSCNKTAGDGCLSMDEVNAMTEERGMYVQKQVFRLGSHANESHKGNQDLWIAGQDNQGDSHA